MHLKHIFVLLSTLLAQSTQGSQSDSCTPEKVENGDVLQLNKGTWKVECDPGYSLVGRSIIKCRNNQWSTSKFPSCTVPGGCNHKDLPDIINGRKQLIDEHRYRGSVVRYRCNYGYLLYGKRQVHCQSNQQWSHTEAPVCTKSTGCNQAEMSVNGMVHIESKKLMKGAVNTFRCLDGTTMRGSRTVFCDGWKWNDTVPTCLIPPNKVVLDGPSTVGSSGGDAVVRCESAHANPAPKLSLSILNSEGKDVADDLHSSGDVIIRLQETKYESAGWISIVEMSLKAKNLVKRWATESSSRVRVVCEATGGVTATHELQVNRPPLRLSIQGPGVMQSEHVGEFRCQVTHPKEVNPAPQFAWKITAGSWSGQYQGSAEDPSLLRVSAARIARDRGGSTPDIPPKDFVVECLAHHQEIGKDAIAVAHVVKVFYPPGRPQISGQSMGLRNGSYQQLTCSSESGNPPATLVWLKDGLVMPESSSTVYSTEGATVTSQLEFVPSYDNDHGSTLTCQASNAAVSSPLTDSVVLEVHTTTTTTTTTTTETTTAEKMDAADDPRRFTVELPDYEYPEYDVNSDSDLRQDPVVNAFLNGDNIFPSPTPEPKQAPPPPPKRPEPEMPIRPEPVDVPQNADMSKRENSVADNRKFTDVIESDPHSDSSSSGSRLNRHSPKSSPSKTTSSSSASTLHKSQSVVRYYLLMLPAFLTLLLAWRR